ncbi:MAG: LysM peptidoglycan-binding domain-containing protein [Fermentimonas sp.]|jgi:membrane-bound lytic murein transglycosylase D
MIRTYVLIVLGLFLCINVSFAQDVKTEEHIPTVADSVEDNSIVYPESMTENLAKLLHEWQIDMSKPDDACSRGSNVIFADSVYAKRLYDLPTEMELIYNPVVRQYIDMYANRKREQVSYMLALGDYYFPMFEEELDKQGLPMELKYLPVIESALNPSAVSRVGATGLWQFMLKTGKGYGLEVNTLVDERRDPAKSTAAAVRYLKDLYSIYGDWNLVIAAYNCGPGNVNKAIARSGGKRDYWAIYNRLPRETRGYVPAFIAANYIMNHHDDHNICPVSFVGATALDTIHVDKPVHFEQISAVLNIPVSEIKRLNPQFKKDRIPANNKSYVLVLPTETMVAYIQHNDSIMDYDRNKYFTHRMYLTDATATNVGGFSGSGENVYYKVRRGDNLSSIARKNGTTVSKIKSWNGLKSDRLSVGKSLIVGKRPIVVNENKSVQLAQVNNGGTVETVNKYYRVRKGDTLGDIARKNNVALAQIRSWNGLKSSRINIGDQLIVGQEMKPVETKNDIEVKHQSNTPQVSSSGTSGGSIISDYINKQIEEKLDINLEAETEPETDTDIDTVDLEIDSEASNSEVPN